MHWLRIERYWGEGTEPAQEFPEQGAQFLPMMCQQCEAAPCEMSARWAPPTTRRMD